MTANKKYSVLLALSLILILSAYPAAAIDVVKTGYPYSHFIGARVGGWAITGKSTFDDGVNQPIERSSGAVYGEFFYAHRFNPIIALEFSIGAFNQGDITYDDGIYYSAATIYPIMVSGKLFPFGSKGMGSFHPYLRAGGGIAYGSRDEVSAYYYDYDYGVEDTEVKITYEIGGGLDLPVSSQIGLILDFKYVPIDFGSPLAGFDDYSGWELSFGVGYIFQSK